jgi:hypothetical protein
MSDNVLNQQRQDSQAVHENEFTGHVLVNKCKVRINEYLLGESSGAFSRCDEAHRNKNAHIVGKPD